MTTFKGIRGTAIESVSSDPSNPEEGQIWYNTTTGVLKGYQYVADAWASGGNLNTARDVFAGAGTQTATAVFGGRGPAGDPVAAIATENYNGTTWTNSGNMSTQRRYCSGCGESQTAGLAVSGQNQIGPGVTTNTEEYGGSTWTSGGAYAFGNGFLMVTGTQTAAISAGGSYASIPQSQSSYKYDGTTWTVSGNLNNRRSSGCGIGTQTAALFCGGYQTGQVAFVESYNGTSFTNGTAMPIGQAGGGSGGTQTAAIMFANSTTPNSAITYNGTSWASSIAQMNTQRENVAKTINGAPQTAVIAVGGNIGPAVVTTTEEYTVTGLTTRTITVS
jgi:hypothetical protein